MTWQPRNKMTLTSPFSKYPPKAGYQGHLNEPDFSQKFHINNTNNLNTVYIPTIDEYVCLDWDYDKAVALKDTVPTDIWNNYEFIKDTLLEQCSHITKTPNGYHFYVAPYQPLKLLYSDGATLKRKALGNLADIYFSTNYTLAPGSKVKKDGVIHEYKPVRWSDNKPDFDMAQIINKLDTIVKYCGEKIKPKKVKIENNQVTSIYSDNSDIESEVADHEPLPLEANDELTSFFNRKLPNKEWTDNLSSLSNNYEVWTSTSCKLKSLVPLYGEENCYKVFHYISECYTGKGGFTTPDSCGREESEMIQAKWDKAVKMDSVCLINKNLLKTLINFCPYNISIYQISLCQADLGNSRFIAPILAKTIKSFFSDDKQNFYRLDKDVALWQPISHKLLPKTTANLWESVCNYLLYNDNFGLLIHPNVAKFTDEKSPEYQFLSMNTCNLEKYDTQEDWENEQLDVKMSYQKFIINKFKNQIHQFSTYNRMEKYLVGSDEIIDTKFSENRDGIAHLFPTEDKFCIDLRSGSVIERTAEHYFTQSGRGLAQDFLNAQKSGDRWFEEEFLSKLMCNDKDAIKYIKRVLGWCMTGDILAHKFILATGSGRNGKTVLFDILKHVLKNFCYNASPEFYVERKKGSKNAPDENIMMVKGSRLVFGDEISTGEKLDATIVKQLTGGSKITGRRCHGHLETFTPNAVNILCCNHAPEVTEAGEAMRDRLVYIPFNAYFGTPGIGNYDENNPNHHLKIDGYSDMIKTKYLGSVLLCLVEGAMDYYKYGMEQLPRLFLEETDRYFGEKNEFLSFWKEMVEITKNKDDYVLLKDYQLDWNERMSAKSSKRISKDNWATLFRTAGLSYKIITLNANSKEMIKDDINTDYYGAHPLIVRGCKNIKQLEPSYLQNNSGLD